MEKFCNFSMLNVALLHTWFSLDEPKMETFCNFHMLNVVFLHKSILFGIKVEFPFPININDNSLSLNFGLYGREFVGLFKEKPTNCPSLSLQTPKHSFKVSHVFLYPSCWSLAFCESIVYENLNNFLYCILQDYK